MLVIFVSLVVAGVDVSATTTAEVVPLPPKCPILPVPYIIPDCGPNAYYEQCSPPCPSRNCSTLYKSYKCNAQACCKPECRCNDGYLRDDTSGLCVTRDECFARCGPTEYFIRGSTLPQETCATYKEVGPRSMCIPYTGCVCNEGRVRLNDDGTGECVLPEECPSRQCPYHEHFEVCPDVCSKETCSSKYPNYKCLSPAIPLPCKPRCICDEGYLRDSYGNCILDTHCPIKSCPANEEYRCTSMCARDSCARLQPGFKCPPGAMSVCIPACACIDGYLRNERGRCIPKESCPENLQCGINEVAVECATVYPPQTCESIYTLYEPVTGEVPCTPGCDCRPGYLRNQANICVPSEFCPTAPQSQCGPNQEYKQCGSPCQPTCASLNYPIACTDQCLSGCFCLEGYYIDDQANCVPRDQCPLPVCNQPNEIAKDCGSPCEDRTCENYGQTDIECAAVCIRGCFCLPGYVRNAYGICVLPIECPPQIVCLQLNEEYQSCGSSCPVNCDNYLDEDRICPLYCIPGCACREGFVRNLEDNTCILPEQCPADDCTGQNESLSYCASYCPVTCANRLTYGDWLCATVCRVACDCDAGTLRNDNGVCVPVEQCSPPVCGQNERYLSCGTACPLTCDNYQYAITCTKQCVEGCFCEEGYVRDRNLRCVRPENCEQICPDGEKFSECSANCQDTCENYNSLNKICPYQCQSGCVCEPGTVRRSDGQCVPTSQCTNQLCGQNEVYQECGTACPLTCDNKDNPPQICTQECVGGCFCEPGYVRNINQICVSPTDCAPQICGENEVYQECGTACPLTCDNKNSPPFCNEQCVQGCFCEPGYVRDSYLRCVSPTDCAPQICGYNEVYQECGTACPITCDNKDNPPQSCNLQCVRGCFCEPGYVRDSSQRCVSPTDCAPQICGYNEVYQECGTACPLTCDNKDNPPEICTLQCVRGCFCEPGYVRDNNQRCVSPTDCAPQICGYNEEYQECGTACPLTCDNKDNPPEICTLQCVRGCFCEPGYVRDNNQRCVSPTDCALQTCGCNEVYQECGTACPLTCENKDNQPQVCTRQCVKGCFCEPGYVRDNNNICIRPTDCVSQICGDNEVYQECGSACSLTYDDQDNPRQSCTQQCVGGCFCESGYVRNINQRCVSPTDYALKICGQNEVYQECGTACPLTCDNKDYPPLCIKQCVQGCFCEPGFVRDRYQRCVRSSDCSTQICGENEIYQECGTACPLTCDNIDDIPFCIAQCVKGCFCRPGLIRDNNQRCIEPNECQKIPRCPINEYFEIEIEIEIETAEPQCSSTEEYTQCSKNCEPTCENPNPDQRCSRICSPGCICTSGLVRRNDGQCVNFGDCDNFGLCSDPNAVRVDCASPCKATCARPNPGPCILICEVNGCVCREGFILSEEGGNCIPVDQCPISQCPTNEYYTDCVIGLCIPKTCDQLGKPIACPSISGPCTGGCVCKDNYVRNSNGICIPQNDCFTQSPCSSTEEYTQCSKNCEPTCENPSPDQRCSRICSPGCVCTSGLVRRNDGQCVNFGDCVPQCPMNEYYTDCVIGLCIPKTCDQLGKPIACPSISGPCAGGCVCKDNYFRNSNGICIPRKDCFAQPLCSSNEEYTQCSKNCEPTCENPSPDQRYSRICSPGCVCTSGLVRRNDGQCVNFGDCVSQCPMNEYYTDCVIGLCIPKTCDQLGKPIACPSISGPCTGGCVCKDNYVRNSNGICIPQNDCFTQSPCSSTEEYTQCSKNCEPTCENPSPDQRCSRICSPGCVCTSGLVRRNDGQCVNFGDCVPQCPMNEYYTDCVIGLCIPKTCDQLGKPIACPNIFGPCAGGCVCKDNYVRNSDGICIPQNDCFTETSCSSNEEYTQCSKNCEPTCENPSPDQRCSRICSPGCTCTSGLVRRNDGQCVNFGDCDNFGLCSDPNAVRVDCASPCKATCARPNPGPCILICEINGCVCREGFILSEEGGNCIPVDQCPKDAPCNGDPYAVITANPIPCPSTCKAPNAEPFCQRYSPNVGCECRPGYIKLNSDIDSNCILPDTCPGGSPCEPNETFVYCNVNCPSNYCPVEDSRAIIACSVAYPCPSGCACKLNYRRKSGQDNTCILASNCPSIKCTRQNEIYSPCPSDCLAEYCSDVGSPPATCNNVVFNCQPKCICRKGYYRNYDDICVPAYQCPNRQLCNDPYAEEVECALAPQCRPTCAAPNPRPCKMECIPNDCVCKPGFVLTEKGGNCIPLEQCGNFITISDGITRARVVPSTLKVCGRNERYLTCGTACPLTCSNYKNPPFCTAQCVPGCFCETGYVRDRNQRCVKPNDCGKAPQCNVNEVYSTCGSRCPRTCQNKGETCPCTENECVEGCFCRKGYVRADDGVSCILPENCPPRFCSDPKEIFDECPPTCPSVDDCSNLIVRVDCSKAEKCCKPQCRCKDGYLRNDEGKCVPTELCFE